MNHHQTGYGPPCARAWAIRGPMSTRQGGAPVSCENAKLVRATNSNFTMVHGRYIALLTMVSVNQRSYHWEGTTARGG
jgi:hypothetical protein